MRLSMPIAIGLCFGAICLLFAIAIGGGGHGWTSAWPFGFLALVLFPIAFQGISINRPASRGRIVVMILLAAFLDVLLVIATRSEGVGYFHKVEPAAWFWIGWWSLWQIAVLRSAFFFVTKSPNNIGEE